MGGGGLGLCIAASGNECVLVGLRLFFNAAIEGIAGAALGGNGGGAPPGRAGGVPFGTGGAAARGGLFFVFVSGSESYMFMPPLAFFSFGIPPANSPPNCGAASIPPPAAVLLG